MSNKVCGYCPMGCGMTLFLGSYVECPNPSAVDDILDDSETEHLINFEALTFNVQHPLRERIDGNLLSCEIHEMTKQTGPPDALGLYRVYEDGRRVEL